MTTRHQQTDVHESITKQDRNNINDPQKGTAFERSVKILKPKPHFLDLQLSISNDIVSTKIYYKRDDFDFEIVNFPCLDGDVPHSTFYGVYISELIRFARASCYVFNFNTRNKLLTQKLLKQG